MVNWPKKLKVLNDMLKILDITEEVQLERTTKSNKRKRAFPKMFMSTTTLKAWRVTIRSAIALTGVAQ